MTRRPARPRLLVLHLIHHSEVQYLRTYYPILCPPRFVILKARGWTKFQVQTGYGEQLEFGTLSRDSAPLRSRKKEDFEEIGSLSLPDVRYVSE